MTEKLFKRASNYAKHVQWVINTYDSEGLGFIHGFQKDAIQNAVGARRNKHSFDGWRCEIDVKRTDKGTFVVVEDYGTVGLTGPNFTIHELDEMTSDENTSIPAEYRLARISVDNSSGGDGTSAGLFGVGKTLYAAASKEYWNYFESISEAEGYRCNMNKNNEMLEKALEGEEGKAYIRTNTGLEPINHVGTRFIVVNPDPELIAAIESGELRADAEETWWRIIKRFNSQEDGIFIGGQRAMVPESYDFNEREEISTKDSFFTKSPMVADEQYSYRSKKIGFFIKDDIPQNLIGFYFYRRGMKIGKIELSEYEAQFGKPYFGFIELEGDWEDQLAQYENATHYDVRGKGKQRVEYQVLKRFVKKTVADLLEEWGYSKNRESRDKTLSRMVEQIQNDLGELLAENGYENIGVGDRKNKIDIRLSDVLYPNSGDAKNARSLYSGESLSFGYSIINRMTRTASVQISISTVDSKNKPITQLELKNEEILAGSTYDGSFVFTPTNENSEENAVNGILISAKLSNGDKVINRKLIYYYKTETEIRPELDFKLDLHSFQFPDLANKGRRVDTDESVNGISYSMVSRLEKPVKVILRVMALDAANNNDLISTVFEKEFTLPANGEALFSDTFAIAFTKEVFYPKIRKGIVTIRARMGLREVLPECNLRKGAILDEYEFKVFFNKPEKSGPEIKIQLLEEPNDHRRSHVVEMERNTVAINISHPEFVALGDDLEKQERYILRQGAKESVCLYASQGAFDDEFGTDITTYDYFKKVNEKIEEIWYQLCLR